MKTSRRAKGRASKRPAGANVRGKRPARSGTPKTGKRAAKVAGGSGAATAASGEVELEAAVLRRLLKHFDERKDVQNIELMILAGFCRNCLSKWLVEAAQERGFDFDIERARKKVYGMSYDEWKQRHQQSATEEQLARFAAAERRAAERRAEQKG
jgi:uncharacterized protein